MLTRFCDRISVGDTKQAALSHFARPLDFAQAIDHCTCSHRPESHLTVKLRPDWQQMPAYRDSDEVAWTWVHPDYAFSMQPGELVFVLAEVKLTIPPPPNYGPEDWELHLLCIQRVKDARVGWSLSAHFDTPWTL